MPLCAKVWKQRGHVYASRTDSETILHLYEERGLDFVHDIEGDFAIALWDADREQAGAGARSRRRKAALFLSSEWPLHLRFRDQSDSATSVSDARKSMKKRSITI